MTALLLLSCRDKSSITPGTHDEHEHHEGLMFTSTLYSDSIEIFTEHTALVKNEEALMTIHVTRLSDYKPLTRGRVVLAMQEMTVTAAESEIPGIYRATLIPKTSGSISLRISVSAGEYTHLVSDTALVFENDEKAGEHAASADPSGVLFTKEQAWASDFMVQEVTERRFSRVIQAGGEILAMPGEKQYINASTPGIVMFSSRNLVQGSRVNRGQILFTISGRDITTDNVGLKIEESRNRFLQSKSEYERHRALFREGLMSEKQFFDTQRRFRTDSVAWMVLSATAGSDGLKVVAPLTGYLHELNVSEGQFVQAGNLLATISTNEILLLRADVSQQHYHMLQMIETARFRPAYTERMYSVEELGGRLLARAASVAENNHYMPVYFEVRNDGSLLEGAFAEFWLITRHADLCRTVPLSSLIEEQGSFHVYLQTSGEQYVKQKVITGGSDGSLIEITEGLRTGDRVVTKGAMLVKAASLSSSVASDTHQH